MKAFIVNITGYLNTTSSRKKYEEQQNKVSELEVVAKNLGYNSSEELLAVEKEKR